MRFICFSRRWYIVTFVLPRLLSPLSLNGSHTLIVPDTQSLREEQQNRVKSRHI